MSPCGEHRAHRDAPAERVHQRNGHRDTVAGGEGEPDAIALGLAEQARHAAPGRLRTVGAARTQVQYSGGGKAELALLSGPGDHGQLLGDATGTTGGLPGRLAGPRNRQRDRVQPPGRDGGGHQVPSRQAAEHHHVAGAHPGRVQTLYEGVEGGACRVEGLTVDAYALGQDAPGQFRTTAAHRMPSVTTGRSSPAARTLSIVRIGRTVTTLPTTPIHNVGTTPIAVPSQPAAIAATGMLPHTTKRMEAFIRPSRFLGQSFCRRLTWVTL